MKFNLMIGATVLAILAMPLSAQAQGIIRGAEEGSAAGNRAAGPVGGAVGGVVGGVEGGVVGGIKGILGIPQRTGSGRDRWDQRSIRRARCPHQSGPAPNAGAGQELARRRRRRERHRQEKRRSPDRPAN